MGATEAMPTMGRPPTVLEATIPAASECHVPMCLGYILTTIYTAVARLVTLLASAPNPARLWVPASTAARRGKLPISKHLCKVELTCCNSHSKAECTKARVFKGACRICSQEGHPASECPDRPPDICKNCKTEGSIPF